jgi:hypothetical protein
MVVGRPAPFVSAAGPDQIAADDGMQVHSDLLVGWLSEVKWCDAGGPDRSGGRQRRGPPGDVGSASYRRASWPERRRAAPPPAAPGVATREE